MIKKKLIKMANTIDEAYYLELFTERFKLFTNEESNGALNSITIYKSETPDNIIDITVPDFVITFRDKKSVTRLKDALVFLEENFNTKRKDSLLCVIDRDTQSVKVVSTTDSVAEFKKIQYGNPAELTIIFDIPKMGHMIKKFEKKFLNNCCGYGWYKYNDSIDKYLIELLSKVI